MRPSGEIECRIDFVGDPQSDTTHLLRDLIRRGSPGRLRFRRVPRTGSGVGERHRPPGQGRRESWWHAVADTEALVTPETRNGG